MSDNTTWGMLAEWDSARGLYHACEGVRDAGYSKWDAHTPFPVHGLDDAMGMKASILPWIILGAAISGIGGAYLLQWWTSVEAYPIIIASKTLNSWPAFVPVIFEVTVLLSARTRGIWKKSMPTTTGWPEPS